MTDEPKPPETASGETASKKAPWLQPYKWQPGQSGNPSGRPKRRVLKEIIDDFYNPETPEGRERLEKFVEATHKLVLEGVNPDKAREFVHDVLDGPLPKETRLAGTDGKGNSVPLNVRMVLHEGGVDDEETPA